jgi:DNA-binding transcriptional MerR regulator
MSREDLSPEERKALDLGELLLKHPDVAIHNDTLRLAKRANSNLRLPEIDLEDKIAAVDAARKEWEEKQEAQRISDRVEAREREVKKRIEEAGFTLEEINTLVKEEGFTTLEQALKFAELKRQSALPGITDFGRPHGARDLRPDVDWRKLNQQQLKEKSAEIFSQGLTDLMRARRAGR